MGCCCDAVSVSRLKIVVGELSDDRGSEFKNERCQRSGISLIVFHKSPRRVSEPDSSARKKNNGLFQWGFSRSLIFAAGSSHNSSKNVFRMSPHRFTGTETFEN